MELKAWLSAVTEQLGTADVALDDDSVGMLLDLARDAAHEVERVAAPLTTYLAGVAVGRGASLDEVAAAVVALLDLPTPAAERAESSEG